MQLIDLEREVKDLKRRLDLAETRLAQHSGQFEFITGQLRDMQLYMHARFAEIDSRFDRVEQRLDRVEQRLDRVEQRLDRVEERLDRLETKIDALPRVIAELIAPRS